MSRWSRSATRCLIGRGSGIVAHERVVIGDDVFTGHHVYITDANHGYEDRRPAEPPVRAVAAGLHRRRVVARPRHDRPSGVTIGRHVVVGVGSVVTGDLPDRSVAVGNPARVIRRYVDGQGWVDAGDGPAAAGDG